MIALPLRLGLPCTFFLYNFQFDASVFCFNISLRRIKFMFIILRVTRALRSYSRRWMIVVTSDFIHHKLKSSSFFVQFRVAINDIIIIIYQGFLFNLFDLFNNNELIITKSEAKTITMHFWRSMPLRIMSDYYLNIVN